MRNRNTNRTGATRRFLRTSLRAEIVGRAARTAAVVGTVLAAINHGPELLSLDVDARRWLQIGLTYVVPYAVATYAATMQELFPHPALQPAPRTAGSEPFATAPAEGAL